MRWHVPASIASFCVLRVRHQRTTINLKYHGRALKCYDFQDSFILDQLVPDLALFLDDGHDVRMHASSCCAYGVACTHSQLRTCRPVAANHSGFTYCRLSNSLSGESYLPLTKHFPVHQVVMGLYYTITVDEPSPWN
jgi:hypothetical protein